MAALHTDALVLRVYDFGESDRIVHLLTPAIGRLTAIAKGARRSRRRFPGTLDLLNGLRVQIERRPRGSMARLEHARLASLHERLRTDPVRFALGCYLAELLDRLAPEGGAPRDAQRLFEFASGALELIEREGPQPRLRVLLELRALDAVGLRPELSRCVRCSEPLSGAGAAGFHVPDGGPVCPGCRRPADAMLPVHFGTLRALERSLALPLDRLARLTLGPGPLAEARALVVRFHRFHLGLELKSEPVLDALLPAPAEAARAGAGI